MDSLVAHVSGLTATTTVDITVWHVAASRKSVVVQQIDAHRPWRTAMQAVIHWDIGINEAHWLVNNVAPRKCYVRQETKGEYYSARTCTKGRSMALRHAWKNAWMTFSENGVPERPFRASLASLTSGKATGMSKRQKMALNHNAVRLELPKLGDRGLFFCPFFAITQRTARSPQLGPWH